MVYKYISSNILSMTSFKENEDDFVLLENNKSNIEEICAFLSSPINVMVMSGFQGTGKSALAQYILNNTADDVILLKYSLHEASTLDDILLKISNSFKSYQKSKKIQLPKVDTKDFREKIDTYIKSTNMPILLVLDSYENILDTPKNPSPITDFVLHLSKLEQFKVMFISRTFDTDIFSEKNISFEKVVLTSIDDDLIPRFLSSNKIQYNTGSLATLIELSKGYYNNLKSIAKLMQTLNTTLSDIFSEFSSKKISFSEYLIFKLLTLAPENTKDFLYLLSIIRHGITEKFIADNELLSTQQIAFLTNISLIAHENDEYFIKNYVKEQITKEIPQLTKNKIHEFLKNTYENQLPQKPAERSLQLSRSTMHNEQKYHLEFTKTSKTAHVSPAQNLTYLTYSRSGGINWETKPNDKDKIMPTVAIPENLEYTVAKERSDLDLSDLELSSEELEIINEKTQDSENQNDTKIQQQCEPCEINLKETLEDYIKLADKFEQNFNFCDAIYCYKQALETSDNELENDRHANILSKVATCYSKTNQNNSAISCYNMAYDLYIKENEEIKANYILLKLAQEYKDNFKFYFAKQNLNKIINSAAKNPPTLLGQTYLLLADIEDSTSNILEAKKLYSKALEYSLETDDLKLIASAYFKYALLLDDTGETDKALEYYKKSIETSPDCNINPYTSSAYSNIALIFYERNNMSEAIRHYNLALDCDATAKNYEGLYFVYSKIAEILLKTDKKQAYDYLLKALNSAKRSKDNFYIASAYLEIGDYHYYLRQDEKALKSYILAQNQISESSSKENIQKIKDRLNDLRIRLGTEKYKSLIMKETKNEV